jgi:CRP-like cAMP-binding protein
MKHQQTTRFRKDAMRHVLELRGLPLFSGLSADDLVPVAAIAEARTFASGETLFEQGDEGQHLYIVTQGAVDVSRGGQVLARLDKGQCVGEMALLDDAPRSATVRTTEETTVLAIARDDFHDLLDLYPALSRQITAILVERMRAALDAIDD